MEAGEENGGNAGIKRQREPLSDTEENVFSATEANDGQKRRRLEASGQENRSPKPSSSGRLAELEMKPDTPMVPSVRSRVQQLTQRRDGAPLAQRCFSDPGSDGPSVSIQSKGLREHLLGEGEFSQRMERFKVPVPQVSPAPSLSPANTCPRTRSDFVSGIQQKLQGTMTPSSKQASRIRQEREQELSQLQFQPISENVWLKRSSSDSSLTQVNGEAEMKDGSFTETSSVEKPVNTTAGESKPSSSEAPVELQGSNKGKEPEAHRDDDKKEEDEKEERLVSQQPETQTVLTLSFSDDQSFSKAAFCEDQTLSELPTVDERSFLQSTFQDESNMKEAKATERGIYEGLTFDEDEKMDSLSYGEEEIDPSTDEELKMWRYPRGDACEAEGQEDENVVSGFSEMQQDEKCNPEDDESVLDENQRNTESGGGGSEGILPEDDDVFTIKPEKKDDGALKQSKESQTVRTREDMELESTSNGVKYPQKECPDRGRSTEDVAQTLRDEAQSSAEIQVSDHLEKEKQSVAAGEEKTHKTERGEISKKVTFILEPELINGSSVSEINTSVESRAGSSLSDAELSSHDDTNTADIIDQMFEEVLEYADMMEEERRDDDDAEDRDSGIGTGSIDKDKMDTESEKEKSEEEGEGEAKEGDEGKKTENNGDELLSFPTSGILSPLSKSVEAVVTPLRLAATQESNPPSLLLTPEETSTPPAESAPLYSIDAYRTQRRSKMPTIQSVTPGVQRRAQETSNPQPSVNTKEKIAAHNEEAAKLQTVINQTLQALSCCTDEEHGRGSLEEAEAEKLLLVSCEKRSALLAEVTRLREERSSESGEAAAEDKDYITQQPCRGTVSITNIQLPLKVEFVCSSHSRAGRPSHYFLVLIRYGPCNIVATPLATAADAQNGDTISFPTSVTLKDIRASFEIDVEVYSLSHTSSSNCTMDRAATKSRVTPRKLLSTITQRSSNTLTAAHPLNTRRSSNFCLVGSHKITLASLGHSKFPLDKMKLEGKIRKLLGDEFQEKVPFLSPLEGNIYLKLDSSSHSNVQHQGFLTMFELISGYGVWHRRYFVLEGSNMFYWNHPNDKESKEAEGNISLSGSPSRCIRPVKRDACARPFTFELVSSVTQQDEEALAKCWFSADTKQERLDWMEKLNQTLLDFHTWNRAQTGSQQLNSSSSLRESIL
ncbi:anillin isoform X1 [Amphiprion ocellaris]|uniref:anillin isoform X1 n=1 Tax=Amphiprion ocellaris TaxID=80972 RepID=UPI002410D0C1|nr:anillin isoform X1 [Amphiprion ocellaris]